jgi:hypothetical protein
MYVNVTHNTSDLVKRLREKAKALPIVVKKAVIDGTTILYVESRTQLSSQIYDQPIPKVRRYVVRIRSGKNKGQTRRSKTGVERAAWKRTGTLLRNERMFIEGSGADIEGVIDNKTPYALARHELNRASPYDGLVRRAQWRKDALANKRAEVEQVIETAIDEVLQD